MRANKGGISLNNASNNHIEANDASESEGTGISLEAMSTTNKLLKNISSTNDGDGIYVGDETSGGAGMWIEGNTTSNNKGYGIFVPKVSHLIKANVANDNGGWGIWASEGSNGRVNVDGGGNKAQGNVGSIDPITLKPLQCFTIRCEGGDVPRSDGIAPDTILTDAPSDPSTEAVAVFRFTGTDNASTVEFQCSIDGAAFGPCVSPMEYEDLAVLATPHVRGAGRRRLGQRRPHAGSPRVAAGSGAGSASRRRRSSTPVPTSRRSSARPRFEFSASERGTTFECSLDVAGDPTENFDNNAGDGCTSPKLYTGLSVGVHTFRVRTTDIDGNQVITPYVWEITPAPVERAVTCGEVLVASVKVTNDLIDCPGNGLVIGTGKITLDLNGHFIDGKGLDHGIVNMGFDSVTIINGTVSEFDYGVMLNPGSGMSIVSGIHAEMNQEAGIGLADADEGGKGNIIRNNTLVANGLGIAVYSGTKDTLITGNALGANLKDGIWIEHASGNRIIGNEITGSSGVGIGLIGSANNVIADNELTANDQMGIVLGEELLPSNGNRVERNQINEGGGGISIIDSANNEILVNVVHDVLGPGMITELARNNIIRGNDFGSSKSGIELGDESHNNIIESNNASGTLGTGIEIGALSTNNQVIRNTANSNAGEGISISDSAPAGQGNLLQENVADGNGGDGIAIEGVGHILQDNSAQLNGGYGIYAAVGVIDRGGNYAAGNLEIQQCYNVYCRTGAVPGEPETWFVETPPQLSHSRNAWFTYNGSDEISLPHEIVYECRIDTFDPLAWEDCEYPAEFLNLSPGSHTVEIRAIDANGSGLPDSSPARYTWTYQPLPPNDPPEVILDIVPEPESWLLEHIFTFHSNEPDVTFECRVDQFGYEPCGFEAAQYMAQGGFEWGLEETEVGPHTFYVRAIDFEGNVGEPTTYTWSLLGIATHFLPGPEPETTGFTPPETPLDLATGGETREQPCRHRLRLEHGRCRLRVLDRPRAVRDLHPAGHLHRASLRRPHAARHRHLGRHPGARAGGVRVVDHRPDRRGAAGDVPRSAAGHRLELDALRVQRDR